MYSGRWSVEKKNKAWGPRNDPRIFVLVVKGEKLLPFWGTEAVAEKTPYLEYYDGEIFAMTGASFNHNLIAGIIFAALHSALRGSACIAFTSDMKVQVEKGIR